MVEAKKVKQVVRDVLRTDFNKEFETEEDALRFIAEMDSLDLMDLCWELEEMLDADIDIDFINIRGMTDVDKAVAHFIKSLS